MTKEEEYGYFGFDRFLQVQGTKYENDYMKLEKKYQEKEITLDEYFEFYNKIIEKIISEQEQE